jgi:dipeptidase
VEKKLSVEDVMGLMRDHYEGTSFDMTKGVAAGPFGSPYRFRGLSWTVDGKRYSWERPISTQQAGFVMVSQCRSWLPDPIGGVWWYAPDDAYTACFTPLYCGMLDLPEAYTRGDRQAFSWDSAWWVFNLVSNLTYDRWSRIIPDVLALQRENEQRFFAMLPAIDGAAAALLEKDEALARRFLTDWSVGAADRLFEDWRAFAARLITKHNDGYVDQRGAGYPEAWLRRVVEERGDQRALPVRSAGGGGR